MTTTTLRYVPVHMLGAVWPNLLPFIESAIKHSPPDFEPEHIYAYLLDQAMIAVVAYEQETIVAVCVLELIQYPKVKACRIVLLSGTTMETWLPWLSTLEQMAQGQGAERMEFSGRDGWTQVLANAGYVKVGVVVHKSLELGHGQ